MGRPRTFDQTETVRRAATSFLATGFEGTSIDDLVKSTGLHRGSLYQAFGSKRGVFVTALNQLLTDGAQSHDALDILLVATLELGPRDDEVRSIIAEAIATLPDPAAVLGERLLQRAGLAEEVPR